MANHLHRVAELFVTKWTFFLIPSNQLEDCIFIMSIGVVPVDSLFVRELSVPADLTSELPSLSVVNFVFWSLLTQN